MKFIVLIGSPRKKGNTNAFLEAVLKPLREAKHEIESFWLYDMDIKPCLACRTCQDEWEHFGCKIKDDVSFLFDKVLAADCMLLATPIYSWYCTPPMKGLLDRFVYGMNKYYGKQRGPSLWKEMPLALITTCGYNPQKGSDLLEEGIKRYCKHSNLQYLGSLTARDMGYQVTFMNKEREEQATNFAGTLLKKLTD